ncbi:MAG: hypothetical protein PHT60_04805 [Acidiphilium sp.]|nr:hypothetical protein [Acidiphilium sp.]MDD4935082.1 hypothetical protein [Acidiphilium sp.]
MNNNESLPPISIEDVNTFLREEPVQTLAPLTRAPIRGWINVAFWGLRVYIVVMLVLVGIGFVRGIH